MQKLSPRTFSVFNCMLFPKCQKSTKSSDIFDRNAKRRQRESSAQKDDFAVYQYVKEEFGYRMADRVWDIKRLFTHAIELSSGSGFVTQNLTREIVENVVLCDTSHANLDRIKCPEEIYCSKILIDDEHLPFRNECSDLVLSNLSLHWVNKLPELFSEVIRCLRNDGVFLGAIFGGQTLYELRCSLQIAESERLGGFSPHISPFVEPTDIGSLLNRAGFNLITIDVEEMTINYPSIFELMFDLQGMAESSVAWNRRLHLNRDCLIAAASIYRELYADKSGNIPATFQVINFIGWKPDLSQPKPAKRGSANFSFKDIENLNLKEQ